MTVTRDIGRSGLKVHPVGLGGMPMSLSGRQPDEKSIKTIHAALDAGMNLIDTADVYCTDDSDIGHNERLIARALKEWKGAAPVVATKGGLERPGGRWTRNAQPAHLKAACDRSLKALGVDRITLYQLHAPDPHVPLEESMGALAELQKAGKIEHVGVSNFSVDEIKVAQRFVTVVSVQNRCNVFERGPLVQGVVAYCAAQNIAFLPHSPVGGFGNSQSVAKDKTLSAVASRHPGTDAFQVALAWLLAQSPVVIAIPGATRPQSAQSSARAVDLKFTAEDLAQLTRAFPV